MAENNSLNYRNLNVFIKFKALKIPIFSLVIEKIIYLKYVNLTHLFTNLIAVLSIVNIKNLYVNFYSLFIININNLQNVTLSIFWFKRVNELISIAIHYKKILKNKLTLKSL